MSNPPTKRTSNVTPPQTKSDGIFQNAGRSLVHDQLNASYASTSLIRRLSTFTPRDLAPDLEEVSHWDTQISPSAPTLELSHDLKYPFCLRSTGWRSSRMMLSAAA
jgi:hypothetical protein